MMSKRVISLVLALALAFALGAAAVFADETGAAAQEAAPAETAPAAPDAAAEEQSAPAAPDAAGTLSFANLESRIRENNYTIRALERQIENIDKTNLDATREDLVELINQIADAQKGMISAASASAALSGDPGITLLASASAQSMQSSYDSLRKQLEDIKSGKTARNLEITRRQLAAGEDQLIIAAESGYIQLKALADQDAALTRGLAALDRGLAAARVSQGRGLVSQLDIDRLTAKRAELVSAQKSLRTGIEVGVLNLKAMIGEELGAELTLSPLPKVTEKQLAAMDLETDLARFREISSELLNAKAELENARQTYQDGGKGGSALRTWEAAQFTYEAQRQSAEVKFRTLYAQVKDLAQKLDAAKSALALEEKNYAQAALKCSQGAVSKNALADAADTLASAKDTVAGAERDLLVAYRSYRWAVERGVLNG